MHLKEIQIIGFKTFAEKTEVAFNPSQRITAIVGPNGCGKSNLVDSFRWVMGEQSLKVLRGTAHDEIIFSGSETARPLSMGEVSLVFDNTDHYLPVDFSEVAIRRRVFRSGESEFFINKAPCRLKDIQKLFLDTGIGRNSYAIVNQGQIDAILNSKPEDRRTIFEEVAGINKYRTQKNESLHKLAATEANLIRVQDLGGEIKNQMGPLKIQAEKADRYKQVRSELQKIEVNLMCAELLRANKKKVKNEEMVREGRGRLLDLEKELQRLEADKNRQSEGSTVLEEQLNGQRQELVRLRTEIEKNRAEETINHERLASLEEKQERLKSEVAEETREKNQAEEGLIKISPQVAAGDAGLRELENQAATLEQQAHSQADSVNQMEKEIEEMYSRIINAERELASSRNFLSERESSQKIIQGEIRREKQALAEINLDLDRTNDRKSELENLSHQTLESKDSRQADGEILRQKIADLHSSRTRLENEVQRLQKELNQTNSRIQILSEMQENYYGLGSTLREVLKAARSGLFSGRILGVLGELIQVAPAHRPVIEAILSEKLNYLVVADQSSLEEVRRFISEKGLTDKIGISVCSNFRPVNNYSDDFPGSLGRADNLVEAPAEISAVIHNWLSGFVVFENRNQLSTSGGLKLLENTNNISGLAALDGEVLLVDGTVLLGQPRDSFETFTRPEQIARLKAEAQNLQAGFQASQKSADEVRLNLLAVEEELKEKEISIRLQEQELSGIDGELARLETEIISLQKDQGLFSGNLARYLAEEAALDEKRNGLTISISQLSSAREDMQIKLLEVQNKLEGLKIVYQESLSKFNEQQVKIAGYQGQYAQIKEQSLSLEAAISRLGRQISDRRQELEALQIRQEQLHKVQSDLEKIRPILAGKESDILKLENSVDAARHKLLVGLRETEKNIQTSQESRFVMDSEINEVKIRLAEIEVTCETLKDRLQSEYEINADDINLEDYLVDDFGEVKGQVEKLRREIHRLEPVNLMAIDELKALEERMQFLESQKADLSAAKNDLTSLIRQLDGLAKKDLLESIGLVNTHFSRIFSRVFSGGTSQIVPIDEADILNSGIEIMVQMPGKRRQNLTLLSGGERALTSAALLFAMLEARPAPFCVLDEVDAPLDENNVDRFIDLLKEFSRKSQILIITHNRRTIAAADVIYGVTMEKPGISKIISLKLNRVEEVLNQ